MAADPRPVPEPAVDLFGRRVFVTGGLGFLGLNTVAGLLAAGAQVRILSRSRAPMALSWLARLSGGARAEVIQGDIGDAATVARALVDVDSVVHLAGESGAAWSLERPLRDLHGNVGAQLVFLDVLRRVPKPPHIVFVSSRLVYGHSGARRVTERTPPDPTSLYAVHKLTVENYLKVYGRSSDLPWTILRVSNPFGPLQQPERVTHGIVNQFVFRLLAGEPIVLYGLGEQLRDVLHVEDVVRAILVSLADKRARGEIFNVGRGVSAPLREIAEAVASFFPGGKVVSQAWPESERRVETGDFRCSVALIRQKLGWRARIGLRDGLERTVSDYRGLLGGKE